LLNTRTAHLQIEPPRNLQDGIAEILGIQAATIHSPQELIL
jgi:hypothetical protein